jgi:hypothetical protein
VQGKALGANHSWSGLTQKNKNKNNEPEHYGWTVAITNINEKISVRINRTWGGFFTTQPERSGALGCLS